MVPGHTRVPELTRAARGAARNPMKETTQSKHAGDTEKPQYKPTPVEAKALEAYWAAKAKEGPRLKVTVTRKNSAEISADHADPPTGTVALMQAIGTTDFDFYNGLIGQLATLASKDATVSESGANFMLSVVKGIEPRDQIEAMLAAQMAAVHNATMTFARRLAQQAREDVRGSSRGAQAIQKRRRAKDDRPARPRRRGRAGDRRQRQRPRTGGGGTRKSRRTTSCIGLCTWRRDATPDRRGAGYSAERRRCGVYAGCTGPPAGLLRATGTP